MNCKKCNGLGSLTIRNEHVYCDNCFMLIINHKFRACIGKSKILSSNENVLVCLTGGPSSSVLLDLIFDGLSLDNHKKLRIVPLFLHLTEFRKNLNNCYSYLIYLGLGEKENDLKVAELVIKQCQRYNFDVYVVNICKYYSQKHSILSSVNSVIEINNCPDDFKSNVKSILCKMTPTSSNDIEIKIKHDIFISIANQLQCNFIFTAETTTTLAINLLSNLAIGRGSQVEDDIGFLDDRDIDIKILRPMKDVTEEELNHYVMIKKIMQVPVNTFRGNSLQSVIKDFVSDLQVNFPATVSTVCKTASKIASIDNNVKRCQFCKSNLGTKRDKFTAVQATIFSRSVSNCRPCRYSFVVEKVNTDSVLENDKTSMFPFIDNYLCYCCSRNYLEAGLHESNIHQINIT